MALKAEVVFLPDMADGRAVNITDGPNDWDMWLCQRGTHYEVTFFTDRIIRWSYFGPNNGGNFISVRISRLETGDINDQRGRKWTVGGIVRGGRHYGEVVFSADYDSTTRKGTARLTKAVKSD